MRVLERIGSCGVVPVVVLDRVEDAIPTANALLAVGVDVMEITLRTAAGLESIRQVAEKVPQMCVGAGTVITLEQGRRAIEAGARFIVSPGFDHALAEWCLMNKVAVTPGCVTPTEIMAALSLGLSVVKFFPANVYGGLSAMKALSGPFGGVRFIPTGGISEKNLAEYISEPFIHATGGSWLCDKKDIAGQDFEKITALSAEASRIARKPAQDIAVGGQAISAPVG
ncbi:MAG: bifunctional 4-hydroxy-2-oxoglutarate aldolase/2-dehydro-3-deoxy-phosphogluconate aldolase [Oscillospiraceae bacterium]|nr:bifunctional 4-hydroxy-2-oxoglutarate aldolase/2-dehydro-3-deoxy-phosphogluconate aldolase [Oscillospiraceae bacterium]